MNRKRQKGARGLFQGIIPEFAWKNRGKASDRTADTSPKVRTERLPNTSQKQITAMPTCLVIGMEREVGLTQ
jgi:hypothetical protein